MITDDVQNENVIGYPRTDMCIDYISKYTQKRMSPENKCDLIIERVREGHILVFEGGLLPEDESLLVERSMLAIDHEKFMGVEISTPESSSVKTGLFGRKGDAKITIVAPSNMEMTVRAL